MSILEQIHACKPNFTEGLPNFTEGLRLLDTEPTQALLGLRGFILFLRIESSDSTWMEFGEMPLNHI